MQILTQQFSATAHPADHTETSGVVAAAVASIESSAAAAADKALDEGANSDDLQERVDVQTEHESKEAADASAHASASVGTAGRQKINIGRHRHARRLLCQTLVQNSDYYSPLIRRS